MKGRVLHRVSLLEAFRRSRYETVLERLPPIEDVFHNNTIQILPGPDPQGVFPRGRALVSLRNIHTLAVVDLEVERVVWASTGPWRMQHEAELLDGGQLLLFDNLGVPDFSRLLEIEPYSRQVTWSYGGEESQRFYSEGMGAQQRLPNGSTLVTESFAGRAFEVTPPGDVVWRFENPARTGPQDEYVAVIPELVRVDLREPAAFCEGHLPGRGSGPRSATRARTRAGAGSGRRRSRSDPSGTARGARASRQIARERG